MKRLTRAQLEEAYKSVLMLLPEGTEISLDDIAEMYERAMSMGDNPMFAGAQKQYKATDRGQVKPKTMRDKVASKLMAIDNPKSIPSTVKSWPAEEQRIALELMQDAEFLQEYAGIKLKSQDGGAELISQMLFNRTKQMDAVQNHMADNRQYAMYHMFTSPSSLPDDNAIQERFKEFEEMQGQSEGYRRGLYDQFTSTRLNKSKRPDMATRYKEAVDYKTAGDASVSQAQWQKDQARLAAFQMHQAQIQTPEQKRQAAVDWMTHRL